MYHIFFNFQPKPYAFTYGVKDEYSGTDFSRAEERSGSVTKGEYRTALPDGRIQIVSYVADDEGYHATVTYEGEPTYPPEPKGGYKPSLSFDVFNNPDLLEPLSAEYEPLPPAPGYGAPVPPVSTPLPPPPPPRKPVYSTLPPPPPPKKPTYEKFRHSNKVTDPYKPPYTVNGRIVGA